jgi:hypothetical protein
MQKQSMPVHKTAEQIDELAAGLANVIRIADVDRPVL